MHLLICGWGSEEKPFLCGSIIEEIPFVCVCGCIVEKIILFVAALQVSEAGVHRPHVAGIHGREEDGAFSIVLSGGYEDDAVSHGCSACIVAHKTLD